MAETTPNIEPNPAAQLPGTVLIIDDDQDMLDILEFLLANEGGYRVETALDFDSAMMKLAHSSPDIAMIDIRLGSSNGLEFIPIIKHQAPDIDCIIMTADREVEFAVKALRYGAIDYLFKPIDSTYLLRTLDDLFHQRRIKKEQIRRDRQLKTILDQSLGLIFLLSPTGTCLEVSSAALSLIDHKRDRILGSPIWMTPWLQHSSTEGEKIQQAVGKAASGKAQKLQVEIANHQGDKTWFEFNLKPVFEEGDKVSLILAEGHDLSDHLRVEKDLKRLALHDPLTELANRTMLYEHMGKALARSERNNLLFSVLYIDLDNFKMINDTFGHQAGDDLLIKFAECLKDCVRDEDIVSRVGGDEFVILLNSEFAREGSIIVVERVLRSCAEMAIREGHGNVISASIGIAIYPVDGSDVDALIRNADTAMYAAKKEGKNCFRFYSGSGH